MWIGKKKKYNFCGVTVNYCYAVLFLQLLRTTAVNPHCAVQELAVISSRVFESVAEQIADFAAHLSKEKRTCTFFL